MQVVYYDIFDVNEEEAFSESEAKRIDREIDVFVEEMERGTRSEVHVDGAINELQMRRLLSLVARSRGVKKLGFRHWGMGDLGCFLLVELFATITESSGSLGMGRIEELSIRSCGITSKGTSVLLSTLQRYHGLVKLDLGRNNLQNAWEQHDWVGALHHTIPRLELQELDLSAVNMDVISIDAILSGLHNNGHCLRSLDISHNIESLASLLELLEPHLPHIRIRHLMLTKGASSASCVEISQVPLLKRFADGVAKNQDLISLGYFSVLPIDRQSSMEEQLIHRRGMEQLRRVQFVLDRNRFIPWLKAQHRAACLPQALRKSFGSRSSHSAAFHVLRECSDCLGC
uniref:Uncharacterized protein n=1 Tax=Craspedostauros australis TaxID=1486917 RepID=A0A7R9WUM8_9STRA